ncbi:McrC family protein [Chryseobacterium taeanense]|uniref:McrC family protein n=1 Tax=Chryseobacterium taeanense TaxID=311334 RepID=UPI0035AEC519
MSKSNTITVFEYERLNVGEKGFNQYHFNALVKFNDLHGGKYFTIGFNKITFKSYVGVLQVGSKVIEILPKADDRFSGEQSRSKWQSALLRMLQMAGYIKLNETDSASQSITKRNLLDIYLYAFIKEVERLTHLGLVKKYHQNIGNEKVLKGRLLLSKHIQHNLVHKERFYTEHIVYDFNNKYNNILKTALKIVENCSSDISIKQTVSQQLIYFTDIDSWRGSVSELDKLNFDRKTEQYQDAISLAKLIIGNYCPDFSAGNQHILAFLFDMNKLFENYIFKCLKKYENSLPELNLSVRRQSKQKFWGDKTIRPDIIISYQTKEKALNNFVVDTKWKVIDEDTPSDNDLKQMFVYNFQFKAHKSFLFYPKTNQSNKGITHYEISEFAKDINHGCELYFAELFDEKENLNDKFAYDFILNNILYGLP